MAQNTIISMGTEELKAMNKVALYELAQQADVKGRSNMTKAQLIEAITPLCDPIKEEDVFNTYSDVAYDPIEDYKRNLETSTKEEKEMKDIAYNDAAWDMVVYALAKEYVKQSKSQRYVYENVSKNIGKSNIWRLFYKNTKSSIVPTDAYMVREDRLFGATCKVIRDNGGNPNTKRYVRGVEHELTDLRHCLNAMVVRGYLSYKRVKGTKNKVNTVFYATTDQMNAMRTLEK